MIGEVTFERGPGWRIWICASGMLKVGVKVGVARRPPRGWRSRSRDWNLSRGERAGKRNKLGSGRSLPRRRRSRSWEGIRRHKGGLLTLC